MSLLICPLCGKSSSLRRFDPRSFDDDIYVKNLRGLGRGRGFEEVDRHSLLTDHVTMRMIVERILRLVSLLASRGVITEAEILSRLNIPTVDEHIVHQLRARLTVAETTLRSLRHDNTSLCDDKENLVSRVATLQSNLDLFTHILRGMVDRAAHSARQLMVMRLQYLFAVLHHTGEPSVHGLDRPDEPLQWLLDRLVRDPATNFKVVLRAEDLPIIVGWERDLLGLAQADRILLAQHLDSSDPTVRRMLDTMGLRHD
jgi:hypothetical protein